MTETTGARTARTEIAMIALAVIIVLAGCGTRRAKTPPMPERPAGEFAVPTCAAPPCTGAGSVRWRTALRTDLIVDHGSYFPPTGTGEGPVVSGYGSEQVYVLALDDRLFAVDARTGKVRWTLPSKSLSRAPAATGQVDVIGAAADVALTAGKSGASRTSLLLDARTGRTVARVKVPTYGGLAWADDRHAVVVASDGLRGIDLRTGATTWRRAARGIDSRYDTGYAHGDIVVVADADPAKGTWSRQIRRINAVTGAEEAPLPVPDHDVASRVTTAKNTIYVQGSRRTYAIDAGTGKVTWTVSGWPTQTVYPDAVDGTAYLWDAKARHYRVVGSSGRQATVGETVQCDLRAGTSLSCIMQAVPQQTIIGYSARTGGTLWTSPELPYFAHPYSLSEPPAMPPPSYSAGIACGHVVTKAPSGAGDLLCTDPYLVAVNR